MDKNTQHVFGLIGYPLGHSFSRTFFTKKFADEGINAVYNNFEIPTIADIEEVINTHPTLLGLNVTIPYKQQVILHLTGLDKTAEEIGAVNVIKIVRDGNGTVSQRIGYNSDCIGFIESIRPMLNAWHKKALVLGTGGASKAVYYGLKTLGLTPTYVSRSANPEHLTYDDLRNNPEIMIENTVIVNTTPLGMYPNIDTAPDIPYEMVTPGHVCFDVVYNPEETMFMRLCSERGASTKNGIEMLHKQAIAAWDIWTQ